MDILNSTITFNYSGEEGIFCYNGIKLTLPEDNRKENIIIYMTSSNQIAKIICYF